MHDKYLFENGKPADIDREKKDGDWTFFDADGNTLKKSRYDNGKLAETHLPDVDTASSTGIRP